MLFRLVYLRLRSQSLHPTVRGRVGAWHDQTLLVIYATLQTLLLGEDQEERQTRDLRLLSMVLHSVSMLVVAFLLGILQ